MLENNAKKTSKKIKIYGMLDDLRLEMIENRLKFERKLNNGRKEKQK